jgi:hypothetical protein
MVLKYYGFEILWFTFVHDKKILQFLKTTVLKDDEVCLGGESTAFFTTSKRTEL